MCHCPSDKKNDLFAPVAVFAYERPRHLRRTLNSLLACELIDKTPIYVFIDGPRSPGNAAAVEEVRTVAEELLGSRANIRVASENRGLAASIQAGVAEVLKKFGQVIVVEDDLELSPVFLRYMNEGLERYAFCSEVYQISGHMFDVPEFADRSEAMFLPLVTTWGWATWNRAWQSYDSAAKGSEMLFKDKQLRHRFNLQGAYPFSLLMKRQQKGLINSWGIRWYWSVFEAKGMSLFPPQSLVCNIGQDGSGTHGGGLIANFTPKCNYSTRKAIEYPEVVVNDQANFLHVKRAIRRQNGGMLGWLTQSLRYLSGR